DPSIDNPDPNTVYARTGSAYGLPHVHFYDYPPTLADLLAPITALPPVPALIAWETISLAALFSAGVLLCRMLGMQSPSHIGLVAAFLLLFRPTLECLYFGQIALLLLFLLVAGMSSYIRGHMGRAGFLLALAAAIKLTPLILLVPFFIWRDWKLLKFMALWGAAIIVAFLAVNGWEPLNAYFLHVMPKIATKLTSPEDRSLGLAIQLLSYGSKLSAPVTGMVWLGRLLSVLALCYAGWLSQLKGTNNAPIRRRIEVIALFLLLSCCVAPVSWLHAWALSYPAMIMTGKRVWERRAGAVEAALLLMLMLSLSVSGIAHLAMLSPLTGLALVLVRLHALRGEQAPALASPAMQTPG
ncbi:MAG TPA: glycosyltransferase family 87 protein, partial [Chthonomonadales bacterium]|nr:glycosyltransferase family 87 protein [Chthonomonadales bacterium]